MAIDEAKLNQFLGKALGDVGAGISLSLFMLGERLGLYKAMAGAGPLSPAELAKKTGCVERYVREWLMNQAAGGYVEYDAKSGKFTLPEEQALAMAQEDSPIYMHGAYEVILSTLRDVDKVEKVFKNGGGLHWGEHDACLFSGTERFFRPNYNANLLSSWIPSLDGVEKKLRDGAKVADVGCGHGASTIIMAKAFPKSQFTGFDYHDKSIESARAKAARAGVTNAKFETALSTAYPGNDYDFVTFFDCLHDMADPAGAAKHVRSTLAKEGTWMIVEPFAGDRPEENLNPVGRIFYGASTMICVPVSLAGNGPALGAQAGEARLRDVATKGGFQRFRRATQTPFNLVLEARP